MQILNLSDGVIAELWWKFLYTDELPGEKSLFSLQMHLEIHGKHKAIALCQKRGRQQNEDEKICDVAQVFFLYFYNYF